MFKKTIILVIGVLMALGLAACSDESNTSLNGPALPNVQNELMGFNPEKTTLNNGFALELGAGIDSKTADVLLERLPAKTLHSAEVIIITHSHMPQSNGFSVVATWKGKEETHCEIWDIDPELDQLVIEPMFTMLVVDEDNGVIYSGYGNEIVSVSNGVMKYSDAAKITFLDALCSALGFFNDYICPLYSSNPIGGIVCAFTNGLQGLLCS